MADASPSALMQSLLSLAWVVEARDPYTGGHLWRVAQFSMLVARAFGKSRLDIARIGLGGFLHDLGKIGIPDAVLNKPDRLTEEEYNVIKTHPRISADILAAHPLRHIAFDAAYYHHETPDGKGYPTGLAGEKIPWDARAIGIADAFDAMTSTRPYRKGMPTAKSYDILTANLGTQFDRRIGEAFLELGKRGELDPIIGHSEPRIPLQICSECGPTILVTRAHKDGDILFCRACSGGVQLHRRGEHVSVTEVDRHGTLDELSAVMDPDLIQELIETQFLDALPPQV